MAFIAKLTSGLPSPLRWRRSADEPALPSLGIDPLPFSLPVLSLVAVIGEHRAHLVVLAVSSIGLIRRLPTCAEACTFLRPMAGIE
jgi:hypothetical protein